MSRPTVTAQRVTEYLANHRYKGWLQVNHIFLPASPQALGNALRHAERFGWVERWQGRPNQWRYREGFEREVAELHDHYRQKVAARTKQESENAEKTPPESGGNPPKPHKVKL